MFVVVYEKSLGCRWYNTRTGEIGGQWGPVGKATSGASFLMHNARISLSGDWAVLDSSTSALKFFWQVGTLNVNACGISRPPIAVDTVLAETSISLTPPESWTT